MQAQATVREVLDGLGERFASCGIESPHASARILVSHVLGIEPGQLALRSGDALGAEALDALEELAARREAGEPLQYITGTAPFRYLELETASGVFIPRPETEVVVQAALDRIADVPSPRVLDLCCGSGTIAVSMASEREDARVVAIDVSPEAAALARRNAGRTGVAGRVDVREGDLLGALDDGGNGEPFDIVVSNPPYIPTRKLAAMPREVTAWEPMRALDGGEDGLDVFRTIVAGLGTCLRAGGWFVCELDEDMVAEAARLLRGDGRFSDVCEIDDLAGRPRAVAARFNGGLPAPGGQVSHVLRVDPLAPDDAVVERASALLREGAAIVFPTDTVYGIGVATGEGLVPDLLFDIKRRERSQTIPWLVRDVRDIERYGRDVPAYCLTLAERFWPGALTLVIACGPAVPTAFRGSDGTIALRAPDHAVAQAIMHALDMPLATTSANLHGRPAVDAAADLDPELVARVPLILDAGTTPGGVPSTIVSCTGAEPRILRAGAIPEDAIMECVAR